MQPITKSQNKRLHQLLTMTGTTGMKAEMVRDATDGRTEHSKEMSSIEALHLITHLESKLPRDYSATKWLKDKKAKEADSDDKMRKKILSICHTMTWYVRDAAGALVLKGDKPQLDYAGIDAFLTGYKSPFKKRLNELNHQELCKAITIFENLAKTPRK